MATIIVFPGRQTASELAQFCAERGLYVQQRGVVLTLEQRAKRDAAVQYLRSKNLYILDRGTPKPKWSATDDSLAPRRLPETPGAA